MRLAAAIGPALALSVALADLAPALGGVPAPVRFMSTSAGPQDWPACGGQCNPSGSPILKSVPVPATGAISWTITFQAHDQAAGGWCSSLVLRYTGPGGAGGWEASLGKLPHSSIFGVITATSGSSGKHYNVTAGGSLQATITSCWGGALKSIFRPILVHFSI